VVLIRELRFVGLVFSYAGSMYENSLEGRIISGVGAGRIGKFE
jgi:lactate dehydrogenase-like 2-hydroxyacid dehydrogenase